MTEGVPPEGTQPLTREQIRQLRRSLTEQVLDRAASDPEWRQLLIDDPELAMREANFPAAQQLAQQGAPQQQAEVMGQFYGQFSDHRWRTQRSVYKPLRDRDSYGYHFPVPPGGRPGGCWVFTLG